MRAASLNDSVDRGSGSPLPPRAAKSFGRPEQHSIIACDVGTQPGSSPSKKLSSQDMMVSPVREDCHQSSMETPSWRKHGDFIRSTQGEDPFTFSHNEGVYREAISECVGQYNRAAELIYPVDAEGGFRPREDRANLPLSADTAQAMLPPNACVFVAKYVIHTNRQPASLTRAACSKQNRMINSSILFPWLFNNLETCTSRSVETTKACLSLFASMR